MSDKLKLTDETLGVIEAGLRYGGLKWGTGEIVDAIRELRDAAQAVVDSATSEELDDPFNTKVTAVDDESLDALRAILPEAKK